IVFLFQAEDGIRDDLVTGVQTCLFRSAAPVRAHGHGGGHGAGGLRTLDVLKRKNFWFVLAVFLPLGFIYIGAASNLAPLALSRRSEERRVGEECRCWWREDARSRTQW